MVEGSAGAFIGINGPGMGVESSRRKVNIRPALFSVGRGEEDLIRREKQEAERRKTFRWINHEENETRAGIVARRATRSIINWKRLQTKLLTNQFACRRSAQSENNSQNIDG